MEEEEIQSLIADLRNFRKRSTVCDRLVAMGRPAVRPLVKALEAETHEGAKWAVIHCLGQLGSPEAAGAIVEYLEDPNYRTVAREALKRIAGKDLGSAPEAWRRWAGSEEVGATVALSTPGTEELTHEQLLREALQGLNAEYRKESEGVFGVHLEWGEGSTQELRVAFNLEDHEGAPIVVVYSDCGPASTGQYETALRRNLKTPYGALAIRDVEGRPVFVMFNTLLREALIPVELKKSIRTVGERADKAQQDLSG